MRTPERAWGRGRGSWTSYLMTFPGSQLSPQPACSPGRELHGGCARLLPATAASWKDRARPAWTHSSWRTAVEESDPGEAGTPDSRVRAAAGTKSSSLQSDAGDSQEMPESSADTQSTTRVKCSLFSFLQMVLPGKSLRTRLGSTGHSPRAGTGEAPALRPQRLCEPTAHPLAPCVSV